VQGHYLAADASAATSCRRGVPAAGSRHWLTLLLQLPRSQIEDKKLKGKLRHSERVVSEAQAAAAKVDEWLLPRDAGELEAEGMERTWRFSQQDIVGAVEVGAGRKAFDLQLDQLGPYSLDFSRSGRHMLLAGRKGHLALLDWQRSRLICEVQVCACVPVCRCACVMVCFCVGVPLCRCACVLVCFGVRALVCWCACAVMCAVVLCNSTLSAARHLAANQGSVVAAFCLQLALAMLPHRHPCSHTHRSRRPLTTSNSFTTNSSLRLHSASTCTFMTSGAWRCTACG
jgi:hypothetical protein